MIWLSLRELRARPWRAALTGMAVVVGVSLISGTFILLDSARDAEQVGTAVLVAGAVSLLVGAFIINTSLSVGIAQRTRELALLRCLGADAKQVRRLIQGEVLIVGEAASAAGLAAGIGIAAGMKALAGSALLGGELIVSPRTVLVSLVTGPAVMLISALVPARRAGRMAPLVAARGAHRSRGVALGLVLTAGGLVTVPAAVLSGLGFLLIPAGTVTLLGVRLLGPRLVAPLVGAVGSPFTRVPGRLARHNVAHNQERSAASASALMIGLALVGLISVLSASTKAAAEAEFESIKADVVVFARSPLSPDLVSRLRAPLVVAVQTTEGTVAGSTAMVSTADRLPDLGVAALATGGIAMTDDIARAHRWSVGSRVEVGLPRGTRTFVVRSIYPDRDYTPGPPDVLIAPADYAALGGEPQVLQLYAQGVTRQAMTEALRGQAVAVMDRADIYRESVGQIGEMTALYFALAGMAVLVGMFGIINTMALSIVDRVRELGLLRAVGMERRQIRSMIRCESVFLSLAGVVLGLALGVLFGWAASSVLADSSASTRFAVPVVELAIIAGAGAAIGVVAAVLPARQASRIGILRAVAAE